MAFDYGSIDLGLRNPFKPYGTVTAMRGGLVTLMGVYLLFIAASTVKTDTVLGWTAVVFGMSVLASGLTSLASGIIAVLRYFVGRNHPTSLARNFSRSEVSSAQEERQQVAYDRQALTEMLVGRKNSTFVEPKGLLARFLHSVLPKLTYMPYPVRNLAQSVFGAWVKTVVALIAFGCVAFISLAGFVGEIGEFAFPMYSILLVLYLIFSWHRAGATLMRTANRSISGLGSMAIVRIIAAAIVIPVLLGMGLEYLFSSLDITLEQAQAALVYFPHSHTATYLFVILIGAAASTALIFLMLRKRLSVTDPRAEVSELRENWQESVHPSEIFINLDNLVMANRRYKEVPNRVYQELEPILNEQVEGKGNFFGEMMQEIQPKVKTHDMGDLFKKLRLSSLIAGNLLHSVSMLLLVIMTFSVAKGINFFLGADFSALTNTESQNAIQSLSDYFGSIIHLALAAILIHGFARLLSNCAYLFFAEIQFESHLIYLKVEGTFTESKISTGTGIHDSTRSENTLIRSSITPWVIVSRVVTSTFAATGMRNLEHPRWILEIHKDDQELQSIRTDIIDFLKDRESIASITSHRDLQNASQIHEINQQSRALPMQRSESIINDENAAGFLRKSDSSDQDPQSE